MTAEVEEEVDVGEVREDGAVVAAGRARGAVPADEVWEVRLSRAISACTKPW